jgi:hypothetical protein
MNTEGRMKLLKWTQKMEWSCSHEHKRENEAARWTQKMEWSWSYEHWVGNLQLTWIQQVKWSCWNEHWKWSVSAAEDGIFLDPRTRKIEGSETQGHRRWKIQELSCTPYLFNISSDEMIIVLSCLVRWGSFVKCIGIIDFKIICTFGMQIIFTCINYPSGHIVPWALGING